MSLVKWTLAMAGTAMTVRYLSNRHRQRVDSASDHKPQTDRDDAGQRDRDSVLPSMPSGLASGRSNESSSLAGAGFNGTSSEPL